MFYAHIAFIVNVIRTWNILSFLAFFFHTIGAIQLSWEQSS